ncbi:MAG: 3-oxoacyl-[acyl-carrier-protein] synthase III C-terminal domain-containing protein [Polyangiaceae bacterium]
MPLELGPIAGVSVLGAGTAFPTTTFTNLEVLERLAPGFWSDGAAPDRERLAFMADGIEGTLGVKRRAWSHIPGTPFDHEKELTTLDLALDAGRRALVDANVAASDLGLVLVSTSTPYRMTSTLSAVVGARLDSHAACMDIRTGCSAGLFALSTASLFVAQTEKPALIIGTETFSKVLPPTHKPAALTLADGAGALVLAKGPGTLLAATLASDGRLAHLVSAPGALPPRAEDIASGQFYLHGSPEELAAELPSKYKDAIGRAFTKAKLTGADITRYVPHQTSPALIHAVAKEVGVAEARCFVNVPEHANVGAAGWIVAIAESRAQKPFERGERILTAAVGGGMSWAAAILET